MNVHKMIGVVFILVYPVLFLGANGQDLTCSKSWGSSCESVTPLVGPPCPAGFNYVDAGFNYVDGKCFKIINEPAYWDESEKKCEKMGAHLAVPTGLLYNFVFTKYLLGQIDLQNKRDNTHMFNDGIFSIGGYFTNNTWEWLTGGDVIPHPYGTTTYGCLAIYVFSDPRKRPPQRKLSETTTTILAIDVYSDPQKPPPQRYAGDHPILIGFSMHAVPCNKDAMKFTRKLKYICQAPLSNGSYETCELTNGTVVNSGQLVSMDAEKCQQKWCQDGTIEEYTCGGITTGCCYYEGRLYGDGQFIGPEVPTDDCSSCHQRVCQSGVVQLLNCANCTVHCCYFNGASYQPGRNITSTCAKLECDGTTGQFIFKGTYPNCPRCQAYLDPHIVAYLHKRSYSYQGCGNYSLSQIGNSYHPTLALYATFVPCVRGFLDHVEDVSCVDAVTFKNDDHTVITISFDPAQDQVNSNVYFSGDNIVTNYVEVNGNDYNVTSSTPKKIIIKGITYPVLAWKYQNCVNLQGSGGFLVRFCGSKGANQVYVWAYPDVAEEVMGCCGIVNIIDPDYDLRFRNGTIIEWQKNPPKEFCLSWLASKTSNGECDDSNTRVLRQTQNKCENNPSVVDGFERQCNLTVMKEYNIDHIAEPEEAQTIIDDCVFDLCHVSDQDTWIKEVKNTAHVQADIQKNTLNHTTATTAPTSASTTVEPYTTPNTTNDHCICNHDCWRKAGYCTKDPESCDGQVIKHGCNGLGCDCCIPQGCRPKMRCRRRGGFCIRAGETCNGIETKDCWSEDCVCCLEADRCKPKRRCWSKRGYCVTNPIHCHGHIINNECRLKEANKFIQLSTCYCCQDHQKCYEH